MIRPSLGIVYLTLVVAGGVGFFAWGLKTPPLETAWQTTIELEAGARKRLDGDERRTLAKTLRRYPGLAEDLVRGRASGIISANREGWVDEKFAYLVRLDPQQPGRIRVRYGGGDVDGDIRVTVHTSDAEHEGHTRPDAPFVWDLPNDGRFPQLVELRFPKKKKRDAVIVEVVEVVDVVEVNAAP